MVSYMHNVARSVERFSRWFDRRFGWFFTNGMKEHRAAR